MATPTNYSGFSTRLTWWATTRLNLVFHKPFVACGERPLITGTEFRETPTEVATPRPRNSSHQIRTSTNPKVPCVMSSTEAWPQRCSRMAAMSKTTKEKRDILAKRTVTRWQSSFLTSPTCLHPGAPIPIDYRQRPASASSVSTSPALAILRTSTPTSVGVATPFLT